MPESTIPNNAEEIFSGKSLPAKVLLSRVFSEDYETVKIRIFDPRGHTIRRWNVIFLLASTLSLFLDPLFFYLPVVKKELCIDIHIPEEVVLTLIRSVADVFYAIQIYMQFHTAYVAPSSRVFGRGELVIDSSKIASRYLRSGFWIELLAALPLPQFIIWVVIPNLGSSTTAIASMKSIVRLIIVFQYLPRLYLIISLTSQFVKVTRVMTVRPWPGAFYNLALYMLASHVLGACWYLLSVDRKEACWRSVCGIEKSLCEGRFFDCQKSKDPIREAWFKSSNITYLCNPGSPLYSFGIYGEALASGVTSSALFSKHFYCLWWGLRNLSSLGQGLSTSTYIGEILFVIVIATLGLVLFALLIGNMQRYLQSTTIRLEEWRIRRTDTEKWMSHRQLPQELRELVRKYDQQKWMATRGVDEEALLKGLPLDLRREIKRHLCLDLVRRVPLFNSMDERMLDAICERLKPALTTQGTFLLREGDPVNDMLFIIRGFLDSYTTNGGRTGFFNSCRIGPGDFCGEELLTYGLDPRPAIPLPSSTRTVKAISEVEAFALSAADVKFVASQFRRLTNKRLRQKFRFYSLKWRTWAACFLQAAWRRHRRQTLELELSMRERVPSAVSSCDSPETAGTGLGAPPRVVSSVQKPAELEFSEDDDGD